MPRWQGRKLPRIDAGSRDAPAISETVWRAIAAANQPSEWLFSFGGNTARIRKTDDGAKVVQCLDVYRFRHVICRIANWYKRKERGDSVSDSPDMPSLDIVRDILSAPEIPLPPIRQIIDSPVFAKDGSLKATPGYIAESRMFYAPDPGFRVPTVADEPNNEDIAWARSLICDELLGDFPFTGDAEKAHAVAMVLQPFARNLIDGPTPLYAIEKPTPGTGATLLVQCATWVFLGRDVELKTEPENEAEWRKTITAKLAEAPSFFVIDNISGLTSPYLPQVAVRICSGFRRRP